MNVVLNALAGVVTCELLSFPAACISHLYPTVRHHEITYDEDSSGPIELPQTLFLPILPFPLYRENLPKPSLKLLVNIKVIFIKCMFV